MKVKRRSRFVVPGAFLVGLSLVAAACGSSAKSTSGTTVGSTGSSATTAAATGQAAGSGTPIKIGWIGTISSTATTVGPVGGKDAMDAWVQWTNSHGGLSGHSVQAFYQDDKGDPAVAKSAVETLVTQDKVVAIVGSDAGTTQQTWAPYVLAHKIPMVNGSLIDATWFTNPMFYPVGGSVIADTWGMMKSAAVAGASKVGVVLCTEVVACVQAQSLFKASAKAVGVDPVFNALASETAVSYTPQCLGAKSSGAQAVAAFVNDVTFARDCARQGYKPIYINADLGPTLSIIKQVPEFNNIIGSSEEWPCLDQSLPAAKTLFAALKQYHPQWIPGGADYPYFAADICGAWAGGVAFAQAISNAAVPANATVTNQDVIRGLSMFKDEDLGGVAAGVTYSNGTVPNPEVKCTFLYTWKNGVFAATPAPTGKLYTCSPQA